MSKILVKPIKNNFKSQQISNASKTEQASYGVNELKSEYVIVTN